jgi:hypothetical protein
MTQFGRPTEETHSIDLDHLSILTWAARGYGRSEKPNWSRFFDDEVHGTVEISRGTFFNAVHKRKVRQPAHDAILCLLLEKKLFGRYAEYQKNLYLERALKYLTCGNTNPALQESGGCRFCPVYGEPKSEQRLEVLNQVGWSDQLQSQEPDTKAIGSDSESIIKYFEGRVPGTFQILTRPWSNGKAYQVAIFGADDQLKLFGNLAPEEVGLLSVKTDGN